MKKISLFLVALFFLSASVQFYHFPDMPAKTRNVILIGALNAVFIALWYAMSPRSEDRS